MVLEMFVFAENHESETTLSAMQNVSILVTMPKYMGLNDVVFQGKPDHHL